MFLNGLQKNYCILLTRVAMADLVKLGSFENFSEKDFQKIECNANNADTQLSETTDYYVVPETISSCNLDFC